MRVAEFRQQLHAHGARDCHVAPLLRHWLQALPPDRGPRPLQHFLPQRLRAALPALTGGLARVRSRHPAADGSERLLVELAGGQAVESVLLPRGGLCVSTQLGCAVGCRFCMTGRDGLLRQLGSAEILAQVALARQLRAVKKVVFMGMGEPAHNLDSVLEAIELLGTEGGIGHKNLVFSTVGDERAFARLMALPAGAVKPALALSLHTTKAALRESLLPRAPRIAPAELLAHAETYARATTYPVQLQWTLLAGVNDGDDEFDALARLLAGHYAVLNLIPYNETESDDLSFRRPSWERAAEIARTLHRRGILTKLRHSAGQDVDAGCGQLRARMAPAPRAVRVVPAAG